MAPAISLPVAKCDIEGAVLAGKQIKGIRGEDSKTTHSRMSQQQLLQFEGAERGESKSAVEQSGIEMRHRVCADLSKARFVYAIPVFQRGFEISLQKINGSQKIIAIG